MENNIGMFIHCGKCLEELPKGTAPRDWTDNEVGWTEKGLQVWCKRHEMNVINLDFCGQKVSLIKESSTFPSFNVDVEMNEEKAHE